MTKKKMCSFLVLGLTVLLLTGCFGGNRTVRCTMDEFEEGVETTGEVLLEFRGNRLHSIEQTGTVIVDEDVLEETLAFLDMDLEDLLAMMGVSSDLFDEMDGYRGVTASMDIRGNEVTTRMMLNVNDINPDDARSLQRLGLLPLENWEERIDIDGSMREIERSFPGFTCN